MADNLETRRYVPVRFWQGWVIYDRAKARICDGVYLIREQCGSVCAYFNEKPAAGDRVWFEPWGFNDDGEYQEYYGLKDDDEAALVRAAKRRARRKST